MAREKREKIQGLRERIELIAREKFGGNFARLAASAEVKYSTLMSLKDSEHEPLAFTALRIAWAGGRSVAWLLGDTERDLGAQSGAPVVAESTTPYGSILSDDEKKLLDIYRNLTEEGKKLVMTWLETAAASGRQDSGSAGVAGDRGGRASAQSKTRSSG